MTEYMQSIGVYMKIHLEIYSYTPFCTSWFLEELRNPDDEYQHTRHGSFPKLGVPFGGPYDSCYDKDYRILGSILGSPNFGKLPHTDQQSLALAKKILDVADRFCAEVPGFGYKALLGGPPTL